MSYQTILLLLIALLLSACQPAPTTFVPTPTTALSVQVNEATATAPPAPTSTVANSATPRPVTPSATASATPRPTRTATRTTTATIEPTIELSAVDATQVANATGTAVALIGSATAAPTLSATASVSATLPVTLTTTATLTATVATTTTVTATATPTAAASATTTNALPTPDALPTASDGRYPKAQESGFTISIVANTAEDPIIHPTSLAWDNTGALYVSRQEGAVIRIAPNGTRTTFATFSVPVGLEFRPGTSTLYVAHRGGITMVRDDTGDGVADTYQPIVTGMSCCYAELHQTNGLQFGNDGWLYFAQGANSDHGEVPAADWHAGILRVDVNVGQSSLEYVATGVRNAYDLTIRSDGQIFATDNGSDFGPPDELNHIIMGQDYGFPDCYTAASGAVLAHPSHPETPRCGETRGAIATFVPHASANGITAYDAGMFPSAYRGNLFVALWSHIADAYRIVRVRLSPSGNTYTTTVTPFVTDFELPLDVAVGPDGALYVADWGPGRIYRIAYGE